MYCDCQLPNKTILPYHTWEYYLFSYPSRPDTPYALDDCNTRFPNNSKIYKSSWGQDSGYPGAKDWGFFDCNDTFPVTLPNGNTYSMYDLNFTSGGFCFQNQSYDYSALVDTTRCLPDTAHPSYQWGFSSVLMGVILIINLVWCLSMWVVWQDALMAKLVRSSYRMSPLRAAFVLTEAARRRTGIGVDGLVLQDKKMLKKELRRGRGKREAVVNNRIFKESHGEPQTDFKKENRMTITRRPVRNKDVDDSAGV